MKVTVCFDDVKVVVPCGDGSLLVHQLASKAIERYRKILSNQEDVEVSKNFKVEIQSLMVVPDGGIVDWDDVVADVLDDREMLVADFKKTSCSASSITSSPSHQNFQSSSSKTDTTTSSSSTTSTPMSLPVSFPLSSSRGHVSNGGEPPVLHSIAPTSTDDDSATLPVVNLCGQFKDNTNITVVSSAATAATSTSVWPLNGTLPPPPSSLLSHEELQEESTTLDSTPVALTADMPRDAPLICSWSHGDCESLTKCCPGQQDIEWLMGATLKSTNANGVLSPLDVRTPLKENSDSSIAGRCYVLDDGTNNVTTTSSDSSSSSGSFISEVSSVGGEANSTTMRTDTCAIGGRRGYYLDTPTTCTHHMATVREVLLESTECLTTPTATLDTAVNEPVPTPATVMNENGTAAVQPEVTNSSEESSADDYPLLRSDYLLKPEGESSVPAPLSSNPAPVPVVATPILPAGLPPSSSTCDSTVSKWLERHTTSTHDTDPSIVASWSKDSPSTTIRDNTPSSTAAPQPVVFHLPLSPTSSPPLTMEEAERAVVLSMANLQQGQNFGIKVKPFLMPSQVSGDLSSLDPYSRREAGLEVHSVLPDGRAARETDLQVGDRILEINGVNLRGLGFDAAREVFTRALHESEIRLLVLPRDDSEKVALSSHDHDEPLPVKPGAEDQNGSSPPPYATAMKAAQEDEPSGSSVPLSGTSSPTPATQPAQQVSGSTLKKKRRPPVPPRRSPHTMLSRLYNVMKHQQHRQHQPPPETTSIESTNGSNGSVPCDNRVITIHNTRRVPGHTTLSSITVTPQGQSTSSSATVPTPATLTANHVVEPPNLIGFDRVLQQPSPEPTSMTNETTRPLYYLRHGNQEVLEICLTKGEHGFGFILTSRENAESGETPVYVKKLLKEGAAVREGSLQVGDQLLKIDEIDLTWFDQSEVVSLLRQKTVGTSSRFLVCRTLSHTSDEATPMNTNNTPMDRSAISDAPDTTTRVYREVDIQLQLLERSQGEAPSTSNPVLLGLSVKSQAQCVEQQGRVVVYVKSLLKGGVALQSGLLRVGDHLLAVNGTSLVGLDHRQALAQLKAAVQDSSKWAGSGVLDLRVGRYVELDMDRKKDSEVSDSDYGDSYGLGTGSAGGQPGPGKSGHKSEVSTSATTMDSVDSSSGSHSITISAEIHSVPSKQMTSTPSPSSSIQTPPVPQHLQHNPTHSSPSHSFHSGSTGDHGRVTKPPAPPPPTTTSAANNNTPTPPLPAPPDGPPLPSRSVGTSNGRRGNPPKS